MIERNVSRLEREVGDCSVGCPILSYAPAGQTQRKFWKKPITYILAVSIVIAGALTAKTACSYMREHLLDNASLNISLP